VKVKLQIMSDLHLEVSEFVPDKTDADVVILAGDIASASDGIEWAEKEFPEQPVIYVPGNHEYHFQDLEVIHEMRSRSKNSNVTVLDRDETIINGVRFLGVTLWTDFCLYGEEAQLDVMRYLQDEVSDYKYIQDKGVLLSTGRALELHRLDRCWLEDRLKEDFNGETVVVSHYAPSVLSIPEIRKGSRRAPGYVSDLESIIKNNEIALWVHGHTHHSVDYMLAGTRVLSNQLGYPTEGSVDFNSASIVEIVGSVR